MRGTGAARVTGWRVPRPGKACHKSPTIRWRWQPERKHGSNHSDRRPASRAAVAGLSVTVTGIGGVVAAIAATQTITRASSYYPPPVLGAPIAADLGLSPSVFFAAAPFRFGLLLEHVGVGAVVLTAFLSRAAAVTGLAEAGGLGDRK
jgi:hypothetical protein